MNGKTMSLESASQHYLVFQSEVTQKNFALDISRYKFIIIKMEKTTDLEDKLIF